MDIIKVQDVGFAYNSAKVLRDITFAIKPAEFVGLIGPNGSGKTTLLKLIEGLLQAQEGTILVKGVSVGQMKRRDLARIIAVVPQEAPSIFPFSVQEIVLMGRTPHLGAWQFEGAKDYDIVNGAMAMTDTLHLADRPMDRLSGGERQRVLIARALAQEAEIMLLDEPTTFLDIRHQVDFFNLIKILNRDHGLTVLAVTHDINLASLYCDKIILLGDGKIQTMGRSGDVVTQTNIEAVYHTGVIVDRHPVLGVPRVTPKQACLSETGSR